MEACEHCTKAATLERYRKEHPRAIGLLDRGQFFVVVADDDVNFFNVYTMIRRSQQEKNRWDAQDEAAYQYRIAEWKRKL